MSNVIQMCSHARVQHAETRSVLIRAVAEMRRGPNDVFWLKENAELLNVFCATDQVLPETSLAAYDEFYAQLEKRVQFFPQYYRFFLSIALDLEQLLGLESQACAKGEWLCNWVHKSALIAGEMSDLQRAESARLLARRGIKTMANGLHGRLHDFLNTSQTFALPNSKAAYELTHIVFYLSDYGRKSPGLSDQAMMSLEYAGLLAFLDQDMDLLAEICVAMRYAGKTPSGIWEAAIFAFHKNCRFVVGAGQGLQDHFHEYLVSGWACANAGQDAFGGTAPSEAFSIIKPYSDVNVLRSMSECLLALDTARSRCWSEMRPHVARCLGAQGLETLRSAEDSSPHFEAFFENFSRAETL